MGRSLPNATAGIEDLVVAHRRMRRENAGFIAISPSAVSWWEMLKRSAS